MDIKVTYPTRKGKIKSFERIFRTITSYVGFGFILSSYASIIVNIIIGGKAWSVIVIVGLYMIWTLVFSPTLVEYNATGQFIKFLVLTSILLVLIDVLLAPGWIFLTIPFVCLGGLILSVGLFVFDFKRQSRNSFPIFSLILISIILGIIGISVDKIEYKWEYITLLAVACFILFALLLVMRSGIIKEFRRRFAAK